jgi:DNA helicase IV
VHRAKGLESSAVILVALDDEIDDRLLYVGASRARLWLTVVGTEELGRRFGLTE